MPKAKAKPLKKAIKKAAKKKPPKDGPVHERMRQASKPNKRSKKSTYQRMREATRPQRRKAMTDNAQQGNNMSASAQGAPKPIGNKPPGTEARPEPKERRGAGSGADANRTRERNLVDWPPEPKTHAEHVEELLQQAQDNEDYNAEVNAAQTDVARNAIELVGHATYPLSDPKLEQESREQVLDEYKTANDPAARKERLKGEMDARAKRDRKQAELAGVK